MRLSFIFACVLVMSACSSKPKREVKDVDNTETIKKDYEVKDASSNIRPGWVEDAEIWAAQEGWDVKKYRLSVEPNISEKSLKGSNKIEFTITKDILNPTFQIDLQQPMKVEKLIASFPTIDGFKRDGDFIYINAKKKFKKLSDEEKHFLNQFVLNDEFLLILDLLVLMV